MTEDRLIYHESSRVAGRLDLLGVGQEPLRESVEEGVTSSLDCTRHDPPGLAGTLVWAKTVRGLRDRLVPQGWTSRNYRNYSTVVHPDKTFGIAVAAGNASTGRADETPWTRTEKGPITRELIRQNQYSFADDFSDSVPRLDAEGPLHTWLLLHYTDDEEEEIRCELALPASMTTDGFVTGWEERVILKPIPFGTTSPTVSGDPTLDDVDVEVRRRSS